MYAVFSKSLFESKNCPNTFSSNNTTATTSAAVFKDDNKTAKRRSQSAACLHLDQVNMQSVW